VSEWLLFSAKWAIFIAIPWWEQVIFQWYDDDVCFVPRLTLLVEFYSTNSLKQQSVGRHDIPFRHIILILIQPVFALTP
jgi:hypothetical protein